MQQKAPVSAGFAAKSLFVYDLGLLAELMDGMPVAIGVAELEQGKRGEIVTPAGRILFYNKRWRELFGFGSDDVATAAEATERLYPDPDYRAECFRRRQVAVEEAVKEGRPARPITLRVRAADGLFREFLTGTTVIGNRMVVSMEEMAVTEPTWQPPPSASRKGGVIAVHRSGSAQQLIDPGTIAAVVAEGKYSKVLVGASFLADHRSIGEWEVLLSGKKFSRLDRSTLVRGGWVHAIQAYGRGARLSFAHAAVELDIGRAGRERLISLLSSKHSRNP